MTVTVRPTSGRATGTSNYIQYFYLPSITIPVPAEAAQLTAVSNGSPLSVTGSPRTPSTALATIRFPSNLLYGQAAPSPSRSSSRARSHARRTRLGSGPAMRRSLSTDTATPVRTPSTGGASMSFDATTDAFDDGKGRKTVTYTATPDTGSSGFWAVVSLATSTSRAPGRWSSATRTWRCRPTATTRALALRGLADDVWGPGAGGTGRHSVAGRAHDVREDLSVNVRGYDGWFTARRTPSCR